MITKDSKNIIVADDSLFFRSKLSDILMEAGHRVRKAKDGKEVIDLLQSGFKPDLIVLDLQMPEVDGFGVLNWINENDLREKIPVLAVTGVYDADQVTEKLRLLGAAGFMTKQLSPEQVVYRINRILFADKLAGVFKRRVAVSIPVDFATSEVSNTGVIINLREGGAFIHTNTKLLEGTILKLKFLVPGTGRILSVQGIVRWFPTELGPQNLFCGCGVMFTSISEAETNLIRSYIESEADRLEQIPQGRY